MKKLFNGLYQGKKVMVTGHTGFKGTWLCMWLKSLGAEVTGFALPPENDSMFTTCGVDKLVSSVFSDIKEPEELKKLVHEFRPDFVFHLAAQSLVRRSYREPALTYSTNLMGTVNVLEACRSAKGVKVIINVTSDKCYENKEWIWGYRENDPMGGKDPYSSSKGCAELATSAYRSSYFNPSDYNTHGVSLSSVRAGNVIGGGDWAEDRLIPDCVRSLVKEEPILIRNPCAMRPWQYVLEPLRGYLELAARMWDKGGEFGGGWNFGPSEDSAVKVGDIATKVVQLWGSGRWDDLSKPGISASEPHEATYLNLDTAKARHLLEWRPSLSLNTALGMTMEWYKAHYKKVKDMYKLSMDQLNRYCGEAFKDEKG